MTWTIPRLSCRGYTVLGLINWLAALQHLRQIYLLQVLLMQRAEASLPVALTSTSTSSTLRLSTSSPPYFKFQQHVYMLHTEQCLPCIPPL